MIKRTALFFAIGWQWVASAQCPAPGTKAAVDLSTPVNQAFLNKMAQLGVKTILRYYDHPNETLRGKTLRRSERNLIKRNGFKIGVVFQHNNNSIRSFTSERGRRDAERSLVLAAENSQPRGTAIYFGVDGGWSRPEQVEMIRNYFRSAKVRIMNAGYKIGVYGSGLVCNTLLREGLAELCWLSNALSWPGSRAYLQAGPWSLSQSLPVDCGGRNVDFNRVNGRISDFGQF